MKKIIILMMFLLVCPMMASAYDNATYSCIDANTSAYNSTTYNATDMNILVQLTKYETCTFGCDTLTGKCIDTDINLGDIGIIIVVSIVIAALIYMANSDKFSITIPISKFEIDPMRLLFFGLALFMIVIDFSIAMNFAKITGQTGVYGILTGGYSGIIYGIWLIFAVLVLVFMYVLIKTIVDYGRKKGKIR
jgi:hypothetical protein